MLELNHRDKVWCLRRLPECVREFLKRYPDRVFLAGGFIRSCIANETVNDIDLFTTNAETSKLMADVLAQGSKVHKTDNAFSVKVGNLTVQFIHRWSFANPIECIKSFDFTIARAAVWYGKDSVSESNGWRTARDDGFYEDLAAKRLVYCAPVRNEDAGGSMLRVLKFYQRGYRIPLDSLGSVIARLNSGIKAGSRAVGEGEEPWQARVITGLLHEVDPAIDPEGNAHLPSSQEKVEGA